jgi:hypothetical protein
MMTKTLCLNVCQFTCSRHDAERQIFHLHGELRSNVSDAAVVFRHVAEVDNSI